METFQYKNGQLHAENVAVRDVIAEHGTPCYIYSRAALEETFKEYQQALKGCSHLVCYAVKANSNLAVLNILARLGAGFDIVSGGELERVIAAGGDPKKTVFSGVAKTSAEMARALELGIHCFNLESAGELERLNQVASEQGVVAPVSVRVNPDVDAKTHPYISTGLRENKFGLAIDDARAVYLRAAELANIKIIGMDCHIGSQLTDIKPFIDALHRLLTLVDTLDECGISINHLDLGGGLGVCYQDETPPSISQFIRAIRTEIEGRNLQLILEPGRSIAANAGLLVTSVEYLKSTPEHNFAIVDAAMNDMLRPALYQAWLDIKMVEEHPDRVSARWDIVGPVCETADFLGKNRELAPAVGELLAVFGAGAYGFVMSSNYNSRGRAPEVVVDGNKLHLARKRESIADMIDSESCLAD